MKYLGDTRFESNADIEWDPGVGEDDELSVASVLWDLVDTNNEGDDQFSLSDAALFGLFRDGGAKTLGDAWSKLASGRSPRQKAELGALFSQANVAPIPVYPDASYSANPSGTPPTFAWAPDGAGAANPLNDFTIQFDSPDYAELLFEKNVGNEVIYTPDQAEWTQIMGASTSVNWIVQGKCTTSPATPGGTVDRYWSNPGSVSGIKYVFVIDNSESMTKELAAVREALQQYLDMIVQRAIPGHLLPTVQLITFKDDVVVPVTTSDIDLMRVAVGDLVAAGGGACPEASAQALAMAIETVARGGTIILATDSLTLPGVDLEALQKRILGKKIDLEIILSGNACPAPGATATTTADEDCGCHTSVDSLSPWTDPSEPTDLSATLDVGPRPGISPIPTVASLTTSGPRFGFEPPRGSIEVPFQPQVDGVGNKAATASRLIVGAGPRLGRLRRGVNNTDVYSFHVEEGRSSSVHVETGDTLVSMAPSASVSSADGRTGYGRGGKVVGSRIISLVATETTDLYVTLFSDDLDPDRSHWYRVSVKLDPLGTESLPVPLFGTLAAATGGTVHLLEEAKSGVVDGDRLMPGQSATLRIHGLLTSWTVPPEVDLGPGVRVNSVRVVAPTTLEVDISVAAHARAGDHDLSVTMPGGPALTLERAIRVLSGITSPAQIESLSPRLSSERGKTLIVELVGIATSFQQGLSTADFGPGIQVEAIEVLSPTRLRASIRVLPWVQPGSRFVRVTTGGEQAVSLIGSGCEVVTPECRRGRRPRLPRRRPARAETRGAAREHTCPLRGR